MNTVSSIDGLGMGSIKPDSIVQADCLEAMALIPDRSIDSIICDLPYGVTACKWDVVIPFDLLWEQYKRIIKPNGAIVLFGSQPFTSALVMSNPKWFKYEWIWEKNRFSGFLHAKRKPLCGHENILIFAKGKTTYNPQFRSYSIETLKRRPAGEITKRGITKSNIYSNKGDPDYRTGSKIHGAYPTTVFKAKCVDQISGRFAPPKNQ